MNKTANVLTNLERLRRLTHATQDELAKAIGTTRQTVSKRKNSPNPADKFSLAEIERGAQFFGIEADLLYLDTADFLQAIATSDIVVRRTANSWKPEPGLDLHLDLDWSQELVAA